MGKYTFCISDIHGQHMLLIAVLSEAAKFIDANRIPYDQVKFVFMGDYIDRGPHSRHVLDMLMQLRDSPGPFEFIILRGNHDDMMLQALRYRLKMQEDCWLQNGGVTTLENYGLQTGQLDQEAIDLHLDFIETMPLFHEDEDRVYVHAGVRGDFTDMSAQAEVDLIWMRPKEMEQCWPEGPAERKLVVHGHTPFHLGFAGKTIGIDGGCFLQRGALKCVIFAPGNNRPVGTISAPSDGVHRIATHPEGGHA